MGGTEAVKCDPYPTFKKAITTAFMFEAKQHMRLELFDGATGETGRSHGFAKFTMAALVSAKKSVLEVPMSTDGKVYLTAQVIGTSKGELMITFHGKDLNKMNLFGRTDAYYRIARVLPNSRKRLVYKSEMEKKTLDPQGPQRRST